MNTTSSVRVIPCTEPTELYRHYDGQSGPQPAYIELDLREGTLLASYNAEVGNAVPEAVYHGFERRYPIPLLTGDAANRVMAELVPLAERILADWEEEWDGNNMVAVLGEDAQEAEAEIEERLGVNLGYGDATNQGFDESSLVAVWDIDGAVTGDEAEEYGITPVTTDERLEEIADEITRSLAEVSASGVAVVPGLVEYLGGLRGEPQEAKLTDAEFRVLRDFLGLSGDWIASHLGVSSRTIRHWEQGKYHIPAGVGGAMRRLEQYTAETVERMVEELAQEYATGATPTLVTYRTDDDYRAAEPGVEFPASWHRAVVARVARQVPVTIVYASVYAS